MTLTAPHSIPAARETVPGLALAEELFRETLRIRLVEEKIIELYPTDLIQSPVHLSIGQEAVATGICRSLERTDLVFGTYRGHAFYLAKGGSMKAMFAELFGREDGCCGGKAGSMHLAAPEVGFMGSSAVVASTIPHAVGAALAARRLKKEQLIVAVFGDGATEEGVYHESLNFAALHRLPVIFVCENNGLAVHSRPAARQAYSILEHARVFGMPVSLIESGVDPMAVHGAFSQIAEQVRYDGRPQFIEVRTARYKEHVGPGEDFAAGYRTREEIALWQRRDPLLQQADWVARFTPELQREIEEAVAFAKASRAPGLEALLTDVL